MPSDAQKRASAKYNKDKMKQRSIWFSPAETDLLEFLDSHDNKSGYLKELIRKDMKEKGIPGC